MIWSARFVRHNLLSSMWHALGWAVALLALSSGAHASMLSESLKHLEAAHDQHLEDLKTLVAFKSVSALPEHSSELLDAAEWLRKRLLAAGLQRAEILRTEGPQPAVFGHFQGRGPGAGGNDGRRPTILIYGHYDVQPVDPYGEWESPPFEVTQRGDYYYGRGVDDDKGGVLQAIHAVEALIKGAGADKLPLDIKFILEGQEEILSPNLRPFLEQHALTLACDLVLSADGGQIAEDQGGISLGLRGVLGAEVVVNTATTDMHSGMKGGSVPNPAAVLASLLAGLHDPETAAVKVPGFYDGVREVSDLDKSDIEAYVWDEAAEQESLGLVGWHGEAGYNTLERRWHRPTLEIVGMVGGFTGPGIKTVIPRTASAKLSARLVPGQEPLQVFDKIQAHLLASAPTYANVTVTRLGGAAHPWTSPRGGAGNAAARRVLEQIMGNPAKFYRDGATIPALAEFVNVLHAPVTKFGWGLGEKIHAPNERIKVAMWEKGHRAWATLLWDLAHDPVLAKEVAARGQLPSPWDNDAAGRQDEEFEDGAQYARDEL